MKTLHGEHLWWTPKQNEGGCLSGNSRITNIKNSFISGYSGVFFIGVLDYGVYVLEEKADSDDGDSIFFYLVVDEEGSEMSKLSEAYSTKPDAEAAGKVKYKERQEVKRNMTGYLPIMLLWFRVTARQEELLLLNSPARQSILTNIKRFSPIWSLRYFVEIGESLLRAVYERAGFRDVQQGCESCRQQRTVG